MKLKNIAKDARQLTDFGQVVIVKPGQTVEVTKPKYEKNTFKVVDEFKVINNQNRKKRENRLLVKRR